ncbi:MAG: hypothetical protein HOV82_34870 [Streptomyces sp.]|nr:hypothetical protein [Streptomyces sp.]NUS28774.1 hypothetical protein [Streptomyces sp.]NUS31319.1 hypothetical protein [Streptomyces sp.]NUS80695.1 hypothetical protein [Streptomyces sp.]
MRTGRRTGAVVLGLVVALATLLGVACLCARGLPLPPEHTAVASAAYDVPDQQEREHVCVSSGHDRCGGKAVAGKPSTGPSPHPQPLTAPTRVDTRPAVAATTRTPFTADPRAPDLHALQVLRT